MRVEQLLSGDLILTQSEKLCVVVCTRQEGIFGEEEGRVWVLMSDPDHPRRLLSTLYPGRHGTVRVVSR